MFSSISENNAGFMVVNNEGIITYANRHIYDSFMLQNKKVVGEKAISVFNGVITYPCISMLDIETDYSDRHSAESIINLPNGSRPIFLIQSEKCHTSGNRLFVMSNITEMKRKFDHITYLTSHDSMTDLLNRNALISKLPAILDAATFNYSKVAVLFIDIDNFRLINETISHHMGDHVIKVFSDALKACLTQSDFGFRYGGDEFVAVLTNITSRHEVNRIVWQIFASISKPILYEGHEINLTASIGISLFPDCEGSALDLISKADKALLSAKFSGKNSHKYYEADLEDSGTKNLSHSFGIKNGLNQQQFFFNYQPQIELTTNKLVGLEALIRWNSANGLIAPDQFIPLAENTGQIIEIGEWVVKTIIHQMADWLDSGIDIPAVSINISPKSLISNRIMNIFHQMLDITQVPASKICIEITESALVLDQMAARRVLNELKSLGMKLSIDDFGTGYSSMTMLKEHSFDEIKIDKSFIQTIDINHADESMVQAIISMAKSLKKHVVAEGIESKDHLDKLLAMNCDIGQGYYFSRPLPHTQIAEYIQSLK